MLSIITIILRYKRTIALLTVAGIIVSAIVSLVIPPRYIASAAFIPYGVEKEITGHRGFWAQLGTFGETYASFLRAQRNLIIDYLVRSRMMSEILSSRFDLERVYKVKGTEKVRRKLQDRTGVDIRPEGVIVLSVEDRDPERAHSMVSTYLEYVDSFLVDMSIASAKERRKFLADELAWREQRVASADSAVMAFLKKHGIYQLEQQAIAALRIVSGLNARLNILEVEERLLEMTMRTGNPELERLRSELENLKAQIIKIQEGTGDERGFFPPLKELPDIAAGYIRLMVDLRAQETVLEYVRLLLEDVTIQANRKVGILRIIDPPYIPEERVWPKRKQIVIVSTVAVFFWTCFVLLVLDTRRRNVPVPEAYGTDGAAGGNSIDDRGRSDGERGEREP